MNLPAIFSKASISNSFASPGMSAFEISNTSERSVLPLFENSTQFIRSLNITGNLPVLKILNANLSYRGGFNNFDVSCASTSERSASKNYSISIKYSSESLRKIYKKLQVLVRRNWADNSSCSI